MSTALKKEHKLERPPRGGLATMVEAIRQGLWEEMERDPSVFLIGEDVGVYGGVFETSGWGSSSVGAMTVFGTASAEARVGACACWGGVNGPRPGRCSSSFCFMFLVFSSLTNN